MKLNVKWFSVTLSIMCTVPLATLFTWCAINGFGAELVRLFESIHPSGGLSIVDNLDREILSRMPGIVINTLYAIVDTFIFGFAFSGLYNLLVTKFK